MSTPSKSAKPDWLVARETLELESDKLTPDCSRLKEIIASNSLEKLGQSYLKSAFQMIALGGNVPAMETLLEILPISYDTLVDARHLARRHGNIGVVNLLEKKMKTTPKFLV